MAAEKMICPDCGVEMNCHAQKVDYMAAVGNPGMIDPDLGGAITEIHSCPECGKSEMRRSSP